MRYPQAYHITFGTYGARLHGSEKPHVDLDHNVYGAPLAPTDPERERIARERMKFDLAHLTFEQREKAELALRDVAHRYPWTIHAVAIQRDHGHAVITAPRDGDELREALKACASGALNKRYGKRRWWAEGGSAKYLWERDYFLNAVDYVRRQRDF